MMDEEYRKWWNSPKQKLLRRLEAIIGTEVNPVVMGFNFNTGIKVGIMHGRPYFMLGLAYAGKRIPFVIGGMVASCNGLNVAFMNKQAWVARYECEGCKYETEMAQAAQVRILSGHVHGVAEQHAAEEATTEGGNVQLKKGALMEWPMN